MNNLQKEGLYHHLMRIVNLMDKESESFKGYRLITIPQAVDIITNYFEKNKLWICSEVNDNDQ